MTFSYTGVLTGLPIEQVRFEIGDTVFGSGVKPDGSNFSNEEIQFILTRNDDNALLAAADICDTLSAIWATVTDLSIGPRSESLGAISDKWKAAATNCRNRSSAGMGVTAVSIKRARTDTDEEYAFDADDDTASEEY